MVDRRDLLKLGGTTLTAASIAAMPGLMAQTPAVKRDKTGMAALKITKIEPFVIRYPKDKTPENQITTMLPIGTTNEGIGLVAMGFIHALAYLIVRCTVRRERPMAIDVFVQAANNA